MKLLKRLSLWDRAPLLGMCAAIVLDFFVDARVTFYLVLATMRAVVAVGFAHLLLAARRLHRWLVDRRMDDVQRHLKKP